MMAVYTNKSESENAWAPCPNCESLHLIDKLDRKVGYLYCKLCGAKIAVAKKGRTK